MKAKLVGFKRFESKKGGTFCVANVVYPYTEAEKSRGNYGNNVEGVFLPANLTNLLTEKDIGKDVELSYTISQGKAYLDNLVVC